MVQKPEYRKETPSQTAGPYVHIGLTPGAAGFDIIERELGQVIAGPRSRGLLPIGAETRRTPPLDFSFLRGLLDWIPGHLFHLGQSLDHRITKRPRSEEWRRSDVARLGLGCARLINQPLRNSERECYPTDRDAARGRAFQRAE